MSERKELDRNDPFAVMNFELALLDLGVRAVKGPEGYAIFPSVPVPKNAQEQRQLEDEWEQRSIEMHAAQETLIPEPKPQPNKISRGD